MNRVTSKLLIKIKSLSKRIATSKGVVLMYHRISDIHPDPWNLNVSESNFEDHLNLFNKNYNVLPLKEFDELRKIGRLPPQALAITFDDGYADNALLAAPLLLNADLPATFYVCTGNLGGASGMWWDTLAQMILGGGLLPNSEQLQYEKLVKKTFRSAYMNVTVKSSDSAKKPTESIDQISMEALYMALWKKIQPLRIDEQDSLLTLYGKQLEFNKTNSYPMMQDSDVRHLSEQSIFEIGAHTENHIQLSAHNSESQKLEITENVDYLNKLTGLSVRSMSYPFGAYNRNTLAIVKQLGLNVACTTFPAPATSIDNSLLLPRITVNNVSAKLLQANIDRFF